ncbi:nuclear transport factor 2 family protein [Daejeonella sp.]|uniref:nuclear transport factor 2 family protein n=1 Tax=Daejeonella sp. TaxID=2805397 RepID=UPI0027B929B1|nr:nuclear transport factor 2 family protein [Daejeonella sp.]
MLLTISVSAQEKKVAHTSLELYKEIELADSILFQAFNRQDMITFKAMFTEDLEWFQDNGGLIPYKTIFENFGNTFKNENKLSRVLVRGSLEVHPLKDYGAIQIGSHQFRHFENGKEEVGTFKFLMIWNKKDGNWKISRVVSYDH